MFAAIRKLLIDPVKHMAMVNQTAANETVFDVSACPFLEIIAAGGVEIHGFEGSLVNRRRPAADPVLEIHKFVPNVGGPKLHKIDMAKVFVQLVLENEPLKKIVAVEVDSCDEKLPLCESFMRGFNDLPLITPQIIYLTKKEVELDSVLIENKELSDFDNVNVIIKSNCVMDHAFLNEAKIALKDKGFIISREIEGYKVPKQIQNDLQILAVIPTDGETVLLMQFTKRSYKHEDCVIEITPNVEQWLDPLKSAIKKGTVLVYSHEKNSGILGLVNCIRKVNCVLNCKQTNFKF